MKKLLLSLAAVCSLGLTANADVTVDFANATTLPTAESATAESYTVDGIDFSMVNCKKGTYSQLSYLQISGKNKTPKGSMAFELGFDCSAIKVHTGSNASVSVTLKLTANGTDVETIKLETKDADFVYQIPEGSQSAGTAYKLEVTNNYNAQLTAMTFVEAGSAVKEAAGLKFSETAVTVELGNVFTQPTLTKATTADVTYESSDPAVATVDEATGAVSILACGTTKITATAAENDQFYGGSASYTLEVIELVSVVKASAMSAGNFVMVASGKYNTVLAKEYGYLSVTAVPADASDNSFKAEKSSLLAFAATDGGYTITDSENRLLGAKATYKTFDTTNDSADNRVWTVSIDAAGNATITNVGTGRVVYQDPKYGSFGAYLETEKQDTYVLPVLYKQDGGSAIETVEAADADAPVEFFNLQGVRVANPENGLFIRRQGNKVEKVVIR